MTFHVRVRCETEEEYKRETQETLDPDWIPEGCEEHVLKDFVIEWISE